MPSLQKYSRDLDYTYAPGIFPSMEAILKRPEKVRRLLISEKAAGEGIDHLLQLCQARSIRVENADRVLKTISGKENCFAAAVVEKTYAKLTGKAHILLHHIADRGNLGTIFRTALALGYHDIGVVRPCVDLYDPHVIRASMGAVFSLNVNEFPSFEAYQEAAGRRMYFPFMLQSSVSLEEIEGCDSPFTLIFGNEGTGLPASFASIGRTVRIPQSDEVDSMNLSVAAAIAMYSFRKSNQ